MRTPPDDTESRCRNHPDEPCTCPDTEWHHAEPEPITAPVTAGGLRERMAETLNTTVVTPEGGIERSTSKFDRHDRHNFLHNCAVCQGNVPAVVSAVLAALAGDPGDLPARMADAIVAADAEWTTSREVEWKDHLGAAAMSVSWEHAAAQAAEVERLRAELTGENRRLRDERDAVVAAVRTAQITHIRETHPDRMHVANCLACYVLVPLSRDLPSRPDDPEEIRRLAQATTEETNDG